MLHPKTNLLVNEMANEAEDYSMWIGKTEHNNDHVAAKPVQLMRALLEREPDADRGDKLPPLWHWLYFPTLAPLSVLGRDGHPKTGGFLPAVPLPRRMWAGGRFEFLEPVLIGDDLKKTSTIKSINFKKGRTGDLCFLTVRHEFFARDELCISEEHDIVYREDPKAGSSPPMPPIAPPEGVDGFDWKRVIEPSPLMLFRYSALTYNGHRIHYDRDYCQKVEGYPGLVFHGPLTATLLIDLAVTENPGKWIKRFEFRAVSPLYDTASFTIAGKTLDDNTAKLWAENNDGALSMVSSVAFA